MKVMNVNHLLDPLSGGGTAERTFQLSRFLARQGIATTIVTLDIGITPARRADLHGVNLLALPCINRRYFVPRISPMEADRLVAGVDLVHLSGHWTLLNALIYKSCQTQAKPFVFCPAGALMPFGRSLALKRLYDILVGRDIALHAAACVAITHNEYVDLSAYGVAAARLTVIPNGIDPEEYSAVGNPDIEQKFRTLSGLGNSPFILFLGRLNAIKGPDLLLEAFTRIAEQFPDLHLVFVGPDDGLQAQLETMTNLAGLDRKIHFTGYLAGNEKTAALRAARLLVIPSRHEAMSIVVLEAGICRTPVLFTDTCGLEEIATSGAGRMVSASSEGLASGLADLLVDQDAMAASAIQLENLVRTNFLWQHQAMRYARLYKEILSEVDR